jgi:hypothetical protein
MVEFRRRPVRDRPNLSMLGLSLADGGVGTTNDLRRLDFESPGATRTEASCHVGGFKTVRSPGAGDGAGQIAS